MGELNIKSTTIEKSLDLIKDFLQKLVGPSVDEIGLLFSDNVKLWRLKNQIRNLEKVKNIVEKEKIDIRQISLKILLPYLEGVSMEDDEDLQNLWANLFANYIDSQKNLKTNVFPNILKQLSSDEIKILEVLFTKQVIYTGVLSNSQNKYSDDDFSNIERLGLARQYLQILRYGEEDDNYEEINSQKYYLTKFGYDFINACRR